MTGPAAAVAPDAVLSHLADLVRINSINPLLVAGAPGEAAIAAHVAAWARSRGLEVATPEVAPGRPNAIVRLRGTGGGRTLILNVHMDTVGVDGMTIPPFDPRIDNGRMYGRGSGDTKASLAAMIGAIEALQRSGSNLRGDVVLAGVADEEYSSLGSEHMARTEKADGCIMGESSSLNRLVAHQGFAWYEIQTIGRAAHGMFPDQGIDAISAMGKVLPELDRLDREVWSKNVHPLAGRCVFHNGTIRGGVEPGIYPADCSLQIEIGCNPGETMANRKVELEAVLARLAAQDAKFRARIVTLVEREPFESNPDAAVTTILGQCVREIAGMESPLVGENAWMDAALVEAAGIPTVVFGPAGGGYHGAVEWVDTEQVVLAARVLAETAARFCA